MKLVVAAVTRKVRHHKNTWNQPLEMVVAPFYEDFFPGDWVWYDSRKTGESSKPRWRKMSDDTWLDTWEAERMRVREALGGGTVDERLRGSLN